MIARDAPEKYGALHPYMVEGRVSLGAPSYCAAKMYTCRST